MTSPQFVAWLDEVFSSALGKVIPPVHTVDDELQSQLEDRLEDQISERILREAYFEDQVKAALETLDRPDGDALLARITADLANRPTDSWRAAVKTIAAELAPTP